MFCMQKVCFAPSPSSGAINQEHINQFTLPGTINFPGTISETMNLLLLYKASFPSDVQVLSSIRITEKEFSRIF